LIETLIDNSVFTPQMALRLEAALGIDARQWLGGRDEYDLEALEEEMGGELAWIRRRATGPHLRPSDGASWLIAGEATPALRSGV
jgi:plasmid maintenance system antidote protein VapI